MVKPYNWNPFKSSETGRGRSCSCDRYGPGSNHDYYRQSGSGYASPVFPHLASGRASPSIGGPNWSRDPPRPFLGEDWGAPFIPQEPDVIIGGMNDITATWGSFTTLEQVQAAPSYTRIEIPLNPRLSEQWRMNQVRPTDPQPDVPIGTFTLHAAHPIPLRYLRQMSLDQLNYLVEYLRDEYQHTGMDISESTRDEDLPLHRSLRETLDRVYSLMDERSFGSARYGLIQRPIPRVGDLVSGPVTELIREAVSANAGSDTQDGGPSRSPVPS